MFAAEVRTEKERAQTRQAFRGQRSVTLALVVLSLAALVWAVAISVEQAQAPGIHAGLAGVKATSLGE